ncbi:pentatricopeptide repeat (PPR) superfamily protein [Striga asiatica]|uniref:Pentatricopeptide repeat (PPR) superfamily protein n=1 Tax=Striga asiatica TaxID=4170 RepID=A0A5A7R0G9_STRAF|nr:pentatricopeptide repeat (PPR) superfamily protein [Striga asiatica]
MDEPTKRSLPYPDSTAFSQIFSPDCKSMEVVQALMATVKVELSGLTFSKSIDWYMFMTWRGLRARFMLPVRTYEVMSRAEEIPLLKAPVVIKRAWVLEMEAMSVQVERICLSKSRALKRSSEVKSGISLIRSQQLYSFVSIDSIARVNFSTFDERFSTRSRVDEAPSMVVELSVVSYGNRVCPSSCTVTNCNSQIFIVWMRGGRANLKVTFPYFIMCSEELCYGIPSKARVMPHKLMVVY